MGLLFRRHCKEPGGGDWIRSNPRYSMRQTGDQIKDAGPMMTDRFA